MKILLTEPLTGPVNPAHLAQGDLVVLGTEPEHHVRVDTIEPHPDLSGFSTVRLASGTRVDLDDETLLMPLELHRVLPVVCRLCKTVQWTDVELVAQGVPTGGICGSCDSEATAAVQADC